MWTLLLSLASAADCLTPSRASDLAARLDAADEAYATFEVETFSSSLDEAALILPCLSDVVPPDVSAHYLRVLGLRYFIQRDPSRADLAFAAARAVDPGYVFPEAMIPPSHAIRTHYVAYNLALAPGTPVGPPREGALYFNGTAGTRRPGWPAIVQVVNAAGAVTATQYVWPGDPLPGYDAMPVVTETTSVARRKNPGIPLAIGAGVAAVASGTLYVIAAGSARDFAEFQEDDSLVGLEQRRDQTNRLVYASIGVGVLAVAGGLGAVFVGKW